VAVQLAPLAERELELEAVEKLLTAAVAGSGGGLVFEGPAGIGKSSLLAASQAAAAVELRVLSARGGELERDLPFGIVRQLLEPVMVAYDVEARDALLAGAAALAKPVLFAADPESGAEPSFSSLHGLYWLASNLADTQPLLLTVDDAHLADVASLRWLVYLARRLPGMPLALVLGTRTSEPGPVQELLDELLVIPEVVVLHPNGLSEKAIAVLAEQLLASEPDPSFVATSRQATGGNPFLLLELFAEVKRRGIVPTRENAGLTGQLSSQGVDRAVRARLRQLPEECTSLARAVAVLGEPADPIVAGQLAGLDPEENTSAADALAAAAIFESGGRFAFVHPLVRSSVYSELSGQERARHHRSAARLLRSVDATTDRIAAHLLATHPGADPETVSTLREAAVGASNRGAPEVAVTYLQRALAEPPVAELEPLLVYELGAAALSAGDLELAVGRLRQATHDLTDEQLRAEAAIALGSALFLADRPEEAMTDLTALISALPDTEREQGLRLQATRWAAVRGGSVGGWHRLQQAGERFAVSSRTPRTIGERLAVATAGYEVARTGTAAEARKLALQALADGRLLDDPGPDSGAFWIAPSVLFFAYADDEASRICTEVIDWAKQHGSLPAFSLAAQLRAYVSMRRGLLAEAEADAASTLEHSAPQTLYAAVALANVLLARGKAAEAEDVLEQVQSELPATGQIRYLHARGRIRAAAGRPEDALDDLLACGRLEREWEIGTPAFSTWRTDAAPLLASLGRPEEARELAREEVDRCRAFGAEAPYGGSLRALGVLEQGEYGIELLEDAVAHLERSPARLEHALALVELGAAIRRAGRRAAARDPLRTALEMARACGADGVVAQAHEELVTAGARPRRDPSESRSNLTASELRVARLAAEGMTNREIAQALFVTENTIETHLRSVFRKLGIRSRSQLARAL
jgi:DNA-binding CsgD family transcriptional regulator/Tfp pilus assembly protein PilF